MANANKRWNNTDKLFIIDSIQDNLSITTISEKLERSEISITIQIQKLLELNDINFKNKYNDFIIQQLNLNHSFIKHDLLIDNSKSKNIKPNSNDINNEVKFVLNDLINTVEDIDDLYDKQINAYLLAKKGKNLFITGEAGCGKTHLIKKIVKYFNNNKINIGVTGSTGVSATLIGGTTIHSFLKMGLAKKTANELYDILKSKNSTYLKKIKKLKVLIIDEISMVDNILFSKISKLLSLIMEVKKPFGGIQVIFIGDFTQLAPIQNTYCFKSKVWSKLKLNTIILDKQMRQQYDTEFQEILSHLRFNPLTEELYNRLSLLIGNKLDTDVKPTILYSKNVNVDRINETEYNKVIKDNKEYKFDYKYDKQNNKIKKYINKLSKPYINLCKGLQVMITNNIDIPNKLVNGTRCIIEDIQFPYVYIKTIDNKKHIISYFECTDEFDNDIKYKYIPLKLAYAITIHKAQGISLDYIKMDLGKDIFGYGMAYTSLSRAKILKNINLIDLHMDSFKCNPIVKEFYENL
jgi:ATP-dependent DNA helicase PIF1